MGSFGSLINKSGSSRVAPKSKMMSKKQPVNKGTKQSGKKVIMPAMTKKTKYAISVSKGGMN